MARTQNTTVENPNVPANGPQPNGETAELTDEQRGEAMWQKLMTPGEGATFADRWAHLTRYYIGAYGPYRVIKEVPERIVLVGKEAVAYALSEIPAPEQEGEPTSFFDAIAKASKGKPHNARRNFGEELFDRMVENFIAKFDPTPDDATRTDRNAKIEAYANDFRNTTSDNPAIAKVDAFLIAEANALRDSEDMRRKVKSRGGKGAQVVDKPDKPKLEVKSITELLAGQ